MMDESMRERVLALLPSEGAALLDEIESHAGRRVEFGPLPAPRDADDPDPFGPECAVTPTEAVVQFPDLDRVTPGGLVHELMHIHRYWTQGVPQLYPANGSQSRIRITGDIEDCLEHQVIVPQQLAFDPSQVDHWNENAADHWNRYPWPKMTDPWVRRKSALTHRLALAYTDDADVTALARTCLAREGIVAEADRFACRIAELLHSKESASACAARFLKIAPVDVVLIYFDPKAGTLTRKPLPTR
jgi:hypothetical protein